MTRINSFSAQLISFLIEINLIKFYANMTPIIYFTPKVYHFKLISKLRRFNSQMQFYFPKMQKIIEPVFYSSIFFLVFGLICIVSPSLFHY